MKTTIDIPENLLKEAMRFSGASTKRQAVLDAMEEYTRRRRMAKLAGHLGTFESFMTAQELHRLRAEEKI